MRAARVERVDVRAEGRAGRFAPDRRDEGRVEAEPARVRSARFSRVPREEVRAVGCDSLRDDVRAGVSPRDDERDDIREAEPREDVRVRLSFLFAT